IRGGARRRCRRMPEAEDVEQAHGTSVRGGAANPSHPPRHGQRALPGVAGSGGTVECGPCDIFHGPHTSPSTAETDMKAPRWLRRTAIAVAVLAFVLFAAGSAVLSQPQFGARMSGARLERAKANP